MKQIGAEIGVNESRVSQLHARAIKRLRLVLAEMAPADAMKELKSAVLAFHQKPVMAKAQLSQAAPRPAEVPAAVAAKASGVVVAYKPQAMRTKTMRKTFIAPRMPAARVAVAAAR
jgi:hypothetical protein